MPQDIYDSLYWVYGLLQVTVCSLRHSVTWECRRHDQAFSASLMEKVS